MRPAVLVHGLLASGSALVPLQRWLRRWGHDARLAREVRALVLGDVRRHAQQLDRAVERVRAETGARRVDLVGASQGGLVALWWAAHGGWDRVGRVVALGTPFRGAKLAGRVPAIGRLAAGIRQVRPGSEILAVLERIELRRPVIAISVRGDPVCPPSRCALPGMEHRTLRRPRGLLAHQLMMVHPAVARAVHEALVGPC